MPDIESKRETLIRHRSACTYEGDCMQRLCRTRILNTLCVPTCLMALFSPREDPNVSSCRVDHCSQPSVGGTQGRVTLAKDTDELGVSFAYGWSI